MSAEEGYSFLISKEMLLVVPFIGTTAAMCFEIGSFIPIGGHAFEQFSLAEHIVFALPALGLALPFALGVMTSTIYKITAPDSKPSTRTLRTSPGLTLIEVVWCLVAVVGAFGAYYWKIYSAAFCLVTFIAVIFLTSFRSPPEDVKTLFRIGTVFFALWLAVLTLLIGGDLTRREIDSSKPLHAIEYDRETRAYRLLRTGDRGLLVYEPKARLFSFIPKESIKRNEWARSPD